MQSMQTVGQCNQLLEDEQEPTLKLDRLQRMPTGILDTNSKAFNNHCLCLNL